jgi:hypothetical protein
VQVEVGNRDPSPRCGEPLRAARPAWH